MPGLPRLLVTLAGLTALCCLVAVAMPPVAKVMMTTAVIADALLAFAWYVFDRPRERRERRSARRRRGLCRDCGYDLTGNASGVCPECGTRAP